MKKILIAIFSILVLLSFTGCGNKEENVEEKQKYSVTINAMDKGTFIYKVNGEEKEEVGLITLELEEGTKLGIKILSKDGYKFVRWMNHMDEYSTDKEIEVTVSSNMNLIAEYDK